MPLKDVVCDRGDIGGSAYAVTFEAGCVDIYLKIRKVVYFTLMNIQFLKEIKVESKESF
jgi:hypothetical protein